MYRDNTIELAYMLIGKPIGACASLNGSQGFYLDCMKMIINESKPPTRIGESILERMTSFQQRKRMGLENY